MAVIWMDGFDHLQNGQSNQKGWSNGNWGTAMSAGRFGGQCAGLPNGSNSVTFAATYATLIFGCAYLGSQDAFMRINTAAGTIIAYLSFDTLSRVTVKNNAGTVVATGTTQLNLSNWNYYELKVFRSATVGTVEVHVNGTFEASAGSLNLGATDCGQIFIASTNGAKFDDIYVADTSGSAPTNDFLGDVKIEILTPQAEGANTAWTANTGTKVSRVNDTTSYDSDTGYILSSTPGDRETFTLNALSATSATVFAVQTNLEARKDDAGTRTIAPVIRIGGVNYDGTTSPNLGSGYTDIHNLYERLDPSGAAWTVATVNAMEVGVKEVA